MENSGISTEDYKTITEALIKASNLTESEWLNIEKYILETYPSSSNENVSSMVRDMWEQLHRKVETSMDRMGMGK